MSSELTDHFTHTIYSVESVDSVGSVGSVDSVDSTCLTNPHPAVDRVDTTGSAM